MDLNQTCESKETIKIKAGIFFKSMWPVSCGLAIKIYANRFSIDEIEDAYQDAVCNMWRTYYRSGDVDATFTNCTNATMLNTIFLNGLRDKVKSKNRETSDCSSQVSYSTALANQTHSCPSQTLVVEQELATFVAQLTDIQRHIFALRALYGRSDAEIAVAMGTKPSTVKSHLKAIKGKLANFSTLPAVVRK